MASVIKIIIDNLAQKEIEISDTSRSILRVLQDEYIDWMHACGGKGRCTTCRFQVLSGIENLSEPTPHELKYRSQGSLKENERLACQTLARGDCRVAVPDDCKMPHMQYTY